MMKRAIYIMVCAASLAVACAKTETVNSNVVNKEVLDAWIGRNWPDAEYKGCGIYVLEDDAGTGEEIPLYDGYVFVENTVTSLSGVVSSTTDETIARRVGDWSASTYYGPVVQSMDADVLPAGIAELLLGMHVGGHRKALVPGWLITTSRYSTPEDYIQKVSAESSSQIYDVVVTDYTQDIGEWQKDRMTEYCTEVYPASEYKVDYVDEGLWYCRTGEPSKDIDMPSDTTVYINYTGRLLNGKVFDTSIAKVAKDNGIFLSSKSYGPAKVTWASEYSSIQVTFAGSSSSSKPITGIQRTLWQMHPGEKGVGVFWSDLGYGATSSGSIPAYAPLIFEIELVEGE